MNPSNHPNGARSSTGLTVQELKQMTALRMSQQAQQAARMPQGYQKQPEAHQSQQYISRGNYNHPPSGHERHQHKHSAGQRPPGQMYDKNKPYDGRTIKPQESTMPHGLTVQELKELTRIRLEREAIEKRSLGSPSIVSETSDSDTGSSNRNSTTYFAAPPAGRPYPINNSRPLPQTMLHPTAMPRGNAQIYPERKGSNRSERQAGNAFPRHPNVHGHGFISDTSSTISMSSSSTEGTFELKPSAPAPILRVPYQPEPWELVGEAAVGCAVDDLARPSTMGSVIRNFLTVDVDTKPGHVVAPPPPDNNPLSPRSLKNRPQMDVECPEEIRRRSRSDSLVFEMAEAVLGTPPGSPAVDAIKNRKRMSGVSTTAILLAGSISPPSSCATLDITPEESHIRRSDSGESSSHSILGSIFRRRNNTVSAESGAGLPQASFFSNAPFHESSPIFPRRTNGNSSLNFFQGFGSDSLLGESASPPGKATSFGPSNWGP